jgi:hypothetical protein
MFDSGKHTGLQHYSIHVQDSEAVFLVVCDPSMNEQWVT